MCKRFAVIINIHLLFLGIPQNLIAGGFEGPGVGNRALSMGGAFAGLADDWSAAFWNPAGLAFAKGFEIGGSLYYLNIHAMDGNSMANPTVPFTAANARQGDVFYRLGNEPSRFGITDTTIRSVLPSMVLRKTWETWSIAGGLFAPLGYGFSVNDDTIPDLHAKYESEGYILMYNASLACHFTDRWSVGLAVNVLDARTKRTAIKESSTYAYSATSDGRGYGFQEVISLLGKLHEKVSLGMVYKRGTDVTLDGTAVIHDTRISLDEVSSVHNTIRNPTVYLIGFAFFPTTELTLTADWHGTDWSPMRTDVQFDQPGVILQNQNFDSNWRFTHRARAGAEYRWRYSKGRLWSFRAGYTYDPSALPDEAVSITNIIDVTRQFYSCGIGWSNGTWEPDVAFSYAKGSRVVEGVDFKQSSQLISVGLRYHLPS